MASIAIMTGGALLNAVAFVGVNYLAGFLSGNDPNASQEENVRYELYNQAHQHEQITAPKEPKFSDFYQSSEQQKQGELLFVGTGALALGYAAFRFL